MRFTVPGVSSVGDDVSRSMLRLPSGTDHFTRAHRRFCRRPSAMPVCRCETFGRSSSLPVLGQRRPWLTLGSSTRSTLVLRQNILAAHGALVVDVSRLDAGPGKATLRIDRTTVQPTRASRFLTRTTGERTRFAENTHRDLSIESGHCVFAIIASSGPGREYPRASTSGCSAHRRVRHANQVEDRLERARQPLFQRDELALRSAPGTESSVRSRRASADLAAWERMGTSARSVPSR